MNQEDIQQALPEHLRQFVGHQDYDTRYTAKDQAVWRLVMSKLVSQLQSSAHSVYFDGLRKTGISLDKIPTIDEMNRCLASLGWRAIVVDGFIPPQAFMELQSLKVLAIALDMRSVENILYTPAPDIVHEAAGHAPIIADVEYSDYLQRFGEVGMKALYNQYDLDLYEAVRNLSIAKEAKSKTKTKTDLAADRQTNKEPRFQQTVAEATKALDALLAEPGEPSELALLTRLHWWTVEYGLVGTTDNYRIFGAGLLSSILESDSCLDDSIVRKELLTVDAVQIPYDITRQQPQLFVTKSCRHLTQVLDEFAKTMSYQTGGTKSMRAAADTGVVTSATLSSGITVSGQFLTPLTNAIDEVIYYRTTGPTQLSLNGQELEHHGTKHHAQGFGSPLGRLCNLLKPIELATEYELQELGIVRNQQVTLNFLSGITVSGRLDSILKDHATILMMTFSNCTVLGVDQEILFDPDWGVFDMAVGEDITSVFAGTADPAHFDVYPAASNQSSKPSSQDHRELALFESIAHYSSLDSTNRDASRLQNLAKEALTDYPDNWLLQLELASMTPVESSHYNDIIESLERNLADNPHLEPLLSSVLDAKA